MKAAVKRKARQCGSKDSAASLGPPDKKQHFDNSQQQKRTKKGQSKPGRKFGN